MMNIMVIHPSPTVCQVIGNTLQGKGHQVQCFLDPVLALQALFQTKTIPLPAILFIHISSTSQLTGYEVLRLFRTHGPQIPVVVICPRDDALIQLKAHLASANLVILGEPVQVQPIIELVRRIAARSDASII